MKLIAGIWLIVFTFTCLFANVYAASVPETLNYQGTLTDSSGNPLTGTQSLTFRLHSEAASAVENAFWVETQNVVLDNNGRFSVTLGADSGNPINKEDFTGQTFIGIQIGNDLELMPRQQLTSVAYALKAADAIPKGGIIMWSGALADIPAGWVLCDGTDIDGDNVPDTPDLRDRFILGAGNIYNSGIIGGEDKHALTINELAQHYHSMSDHRHSIDPPNTNSGGQSATHNHQANADGGTDNSNGGYFRIDSGVSKTIPTGAASNNHTHAINIPAFWSSYNGSGNTSSAGVGAAHNNMPPYYSLAFIMKL